MTTSRKLLWPLYIAVSFLSVLIAGTISPTPTVHADGGDLCQFNGPISIVPGVPYLYNFRVEDDFEDDIFGRFSFDHEFSVDLNNEIGSSAITAVVFEEGRDDDDEDAGGLDKRDFHEVKGSGNFAQGIDVESPPFVDEDLLEFMYRRYGPFILEGNPCGVGAREIINECIDADECDTFLRTADKKQKEAWIDAIDEALKQGVFRCLETDPDDHENRRGLNDESLQEIGDKALIGAGYHNREGRNEIKAFLVIVCDDLAPFPPNILDGIGFFEVTCDRPGRFSLSLSDQGVFDLGSTKIKPNPANRAKLEVECKDVPSTLSTIAHFPGTVEIAPAPGRLSHSLVMVTLFDKNGYTPASGFEVDFATDRCAIETSGVDTAEELAFASGLFSTYTTAVEVSAENIETSAPALAEVDSEDLYFDTMRSVDVGSPVSSRAAAILSCNPEDAPGTTPGVATITALVVIEDAEDVVLQVKVLVVGPPALIAITPTPETVRCGEKAAIRVEVADAVRNPVSDLTRVDVVTNMGGVLAGTGAVAGQAGPVVPISSTVVDTFNGVAAFYLLTSEQHVGTYEVVVATGGPTTRTTTLGSRFSTPQLTASTQVTCVSNAAVAPPQAVAGATSPTTPPPVTAAAPAPVIRPPSTGDAGLLD